ncbi:pentapeptide repeat-containing protein [Kribbella orskensis]|uniref:pentapeptide repeat-containing protein n=1 Tax=Kribbella orskensis TaxID=2512216 RepID=UPI0034E1B294
MTGADLRGANLQAANLRNANLTGARWSSTTRWPLAIAQDLRTASTRTATTDADGEWTVHNWAHP